MLVIVPVAVVEGQDEGARGQRPVVEQVGEGDGLHSAPPQLPQVGGHGAGRDMDIGSGFRRRFRYDPVITEDRQGALSDPAFDAGIEVTLLDGGRDVVAVVTRQLGLEPRRIRPEPFNKALQVGRDHDGIGFDLFATVTEVRPGGIEERIVAHVSGPAGFADGVHGGAGLDCLQRDPPRAEDQVGFGKGRREIRAPPGELHIRRRTGRDFVGHRSAHHQETGAGEAVEHLRGEPPRELSLGAGQAADEGNA